MKVVIKNNEIGIQRVAQVVVLDPPKTTLEDASVTRLPISDSLHTMLVFPAYDLTLQDPLLLDQEVAYLSPMLAFNLSFHTSCLKSLVHQGNEVLEKYFEAKFDEDLNGKSGVGASKIALDLEPVSEVPLYASHLRVSFVKIPECGTIQSLKVSSSFEAEERQGLIDSALHKYFGVDRQLSRGDVFRIYIEWNCGSSICIPCSQRSCSRSDDFIYFKVNTVCLFFCQKKKKKTNSGLNLLNYIVSVLRLLRWNLLMRGFFESITPKPLSYSEELSLLVFHQICWYLDQRFICPCRRIQ